MAEANRRRVPEPAEGQCGVPRKLKVFLHVPTRLTRLQKSFAGIFGSQYPQNISHWQMLEAGNLRWLQLEAQNPTVLQLSALSDEHKQNPWIANDAIRPSTNLEALPCLLARAQWEEDTALWALAHSTWSLHWPHWSLATLVGICFVSAEPQISHKVGS